MNVDFFENSAVALTLYSVLQRPIPKIATQFNPRPWKTLFIIFSTTSYGVCSQHCYCTANCFRLHCPRTTSRTQIVKFVGLTRYHTHTHTHHEQSCSHIKVWSTNRNTTIRRTLRVLNLSIRNSPKTYKWVYHFRSFARVFVKNVTDALVGSPLRYE